MCSSHGDNVMRVKLLSPNAIMPARASENAAGFDLSAAHAAVVPARGTAVIMIDCSISIPPLTYARIAPRSGLALKRMIATGAGVIDYDFRGNVGIVLFNHGSEDFAVERGDRIAQLILERISMAPAVQVLDLEDSTRGKAGFGSTGGSAALPSCSSAADT